MVYTHNINPIIISLGSLDLYWYGAMYAFSFLIIDFLMKKDTLNGSSEFSNKTIDTLLFISIISLLLGGRLGYVVFYDFNFYLNNLEKIFFIWEGGMSFHGGLIGVIAGSMYLSIRENINFFNLSDYIVLYIPIGLGLGRIGNFINGELYGIPTNSSWGIIFPLVDNLPRHPSMLYEFFMEGVLLFIILKMISKLHMPRGIMSSAFLILYSIFRFLIEFVRVPDSQIGYLYNEWFTMGQLLSVPMFIIGFMLLYFSMRGKQSQ